MTQLFRLHKLYWIATFLALLLGFLITAKAYAQTSQATGSAEEIAKKYGVTFPIVDLGGCSDITSCRNFCEDPLNNATCINYARQKGFYQEDNLEKDKNKVLVAAKSTLGCDSQASCQNFCEVPANYDKCHSFAQTQGISGGRIEDPGRAPIIERARQVLGCTSADSCKSYCEQEANKGKCGDFARQVGLHGGEHKVGPGGCTSEATCKSFCADPNNFQVCSGFTSVSGGTFSGPGGCNNEASCKSYCASHPQDCGYKAGEQPNVTQVKYNPQEMCNRTPNCSWSSNGCQCGFYGETKETAQEAQKYASFCQANPDKCRVGTQGSFDTAALRTQFEDFCSQNADKCRVTTTATSTTSTNAYFGNPATECSRYGCNWTGSTCQCAGFKDTYSYPTPYTYSYPTPGGFYSYPTPYSYSYPTPYSNSRESQEDGCKAGGGTCDWSSGYCNCQGYKYPTPTYSYPTPYSGTYPYPTPYSYSYPTPGGYYSYPTPYSYSYPTPYSYSYPTPGTYSYPTPQAYSYPTPQAYSYPTPQAYSYPTPQSYSYPTPQSYSYPTPGVQGVSTVRTKSLWEQFLEWLGR